MAKPTLYIFTISHYCEKARWALEYLGIKYNLIHLGAGLHMQLGQQLGLEQSSLPILKTDNGVIQGSSEIIDWADQHTTNGKTLTPIGREQQCRQLEQQLDKVLGVHTRRHFYSEALVEHPESVKSIFRCNLPSDQQIELDKIWEFVAPLMVESMDLGRAQGEESEAIVDTELCSIEKLLANGRSYLASDQVSRADITAASLCARMANAKEYPSFAAMSLPPRLEKTQQQWINRPALSWIRKIYQQHRDEK
jgi:glutathione S-transferase